jgi:uncharacterized protein YndB with AHSA1/START domain
MKENNIVTSTMNASRSELVNTHVFNAPRGLVFKLWTDFDHLIKWWCPEGFTMSKSNLTLRSGHVLHFVMKSPDGQEICGKLVYKETVAPEKAVFVKSFADSDGNMVRAPFCSEFPLEVLNVLTFEEQDGKTILTVKGYPINATEEELEFFESMHSNMQQSFIGTFENLEKYLAELI